MNNKIIKREAVITLVVFFIFFLWWFYFAYIYPPKDVLKYKYILGLPDWFFYSCILGYLLLNTLIIFLVKFIFTDIDLEKEGE